MSPMFRAAHLSSFLMFLVAIVATSAIAFGEPDPNYKPEELAGASCNQDVQALAADGGIYTLIYRPVFGAGVQNGIVRHRADGSIDKNWGANGEVKLPATVSQLQTIEDGGLYAIGTSISRYQRDGMRDSLFGVSGLSDLIVPTGSSLRGTAQQADGSLVTLASSDTGRVFIRTNSRGVRDASFGHGGIFSIPFNTVPAEAIIYAWSVKTDGSLELAWYQKSSAVPLQLQFSVKRLRNDLSAADSDFDAGGRLVPRQGVADWLSPVARVQADGALLLATYDCLDTTCDEPLIAVRRYAAAGNVDTGYGAGGKTVFRLLPGERDPRSRATPSQMWLGKDGKLTILMTGVRQFGSFGFSLTGILAYRLNVDGTLDATFENGKPTLNVDSTMFLQLDDGSLVRPRSNATDTGCAPRKYLTDVPRTAAVAVEYFSALLDRYFITAHEFEKVFVDNGMAGDWRRTGQSFGAFSIEVSAPGTAPVCRFYSGTNGGPVSHFYSAEKFECDILARLEAQTPADKPAWRFERDAFRITVPIAGNCPANLTPLYRLYNNGAAQGKGSNHRYVSDLVLLASMQAKGWISEGVRMCMPPASRSDRTRELY